MHNRWDAFETIPACAKPIDALIDASHGTGHGVAHDATRTLTPTDRVDRRGMLDTVVTVTATSFHSSPYH